MLMRKISPENLFEIILLPLLFIGIFIAGGTIFLVLGLYDQILFASWCFISAGIVVCIVVIYTYIIIQKRI
jgi:hypothetical protein